jgi:hypothetical protein
MRVFAVLALLLFSQAVSAVCPKHTFTDPKRVNIKGNTVMIVTHPTSFHDSRLATKRGLDEAVLFAKGKKIPVIYLQDESPEQFYFMEDCKPDYWVRSEGGELGFEVTPDHVYVLGGHLELCMSHTVNEIIHSWAKQKKKNVKITFLMDAIYSNGKNIDTAASYYADFEKFMNVVNYRRPGGEHWFKLSLLETMGVIRSEANELEYLKDILPQYENTLPKYRVELTLNDSVVKVLQTAQGWTPSTIHFEFIDSILELDK